MWFIRPYFPFFHRRGERPQARLPEVPIPAHHWQVWLHALMNQFGTTRTAVLGLFASCQMNLKAEVNTVTPDWQRSAHKSCDRVAHFNASSGRGSDTSRGGPPATLSHRHLCHLNNLPPFIHAPPPPSPTVPSPRWMQLMFVKENADSNVREAAER